MQKTFRKERGGVCWKSANQCSYEETKEFAHALARRMEQMHPELVVSKMQKALRKGKIFVDWRQNDDHKTTVNVYSLRARERPTVSTPVTWDEVETVLKTKNAKRPSKQPRVATAFLAPIKKKNFARTFATVLPSFGFRAGDLKTPAPSTFTIRSGFREAFSKVRPLFRHEDKRNAIPQD